MKTEINKYFRLPKCGRWHRKAHLRLFIPTIDRWYWRGLWHDLMGDWGNTLGRAEIGTSCGDCYCPLTYSNRIVLGFLGFTAQLWITRDRMPKPCLCDLSLWDELPDDYAEEVAEFGGSAAVKAALKKRLSMMRRIGPRSATWTHT